MLKVCLLSLTAAYANAISLDAEIEALLQAEEEFKDSEEPCAFPDTDQFNTKEYFA